MSGGNAPWPVRRNALKLNCPPPQSVQSPTPRRQDSRSPIVETPGSYVHRQSPTLKRQDPRSPIVETPGSCAPSHSRTPLESPRVTFTEMPFSPRIRCVPVELIREEDEAEAKEGQRRSSVRKVDLGGLFW